MDTGSDATVEARLAALEQALAALARLVRELIEDNRRIAGKPLRE